MSLFDTLTYEDILTRVLARMDNTVLQTREGSYAYDQAAPMCMELWMLYATLQELISAFYIDEYSGKYLDAHAKLFAMQRREGTKAACAVRLQGREGLTVPAGTCFYTEDGLEFGLSADVTLRDGQGEGLLRAAKVGDAYNVSAGSITQILRSIRGLDSFDAEEAEGGTDPESDAALFERIDERRKRPPTSGNPDHYRQWALSVDGVGDVKVTRVWRGPGTVKVLICGYDRLPVDDATVQRCRDYIETQRPIGAEVTVVSAVACPVTVSARVVLLGSASRAVVRERLRELTEEYLAQAAFRETVVYVNRIGALLMSIDGVVDYTTLTVNGAEDNLVLDADSVPVLEGVEIL